MLGQEVNPATQWRSIVVLIQWCNSWE